MRCSLAPGFVPLGRKRPQGNLRNITKPRGILLYQFHNPSEQAEFTIPALAQVTCGFEGVLRYRLGAGTPGEKRAAAELG